jgi:hypothetical protein
MTLQKSVLITGLARNTESHLKKEIKRIEAQISKVFGNIKFLVIESDSKDNTVGELLEISSEMPNFKFISLHSLESEIPNRIKRLTHCRNTYVNELRLNKEYREIEFVMIIDFDIKNNRLDLKVLKDWINKPNWTALFANQTGAYFDIYALRKQGWSEGDCFQEYFKLLEFFNPEDAKHKAIWSKMLKVRKDTKPIRVLSAFGGLGIYRKEVFFAHDYSPTSDNYEISEHVVLHNKLRDNFDELLILPNLTNFSWNPHNLSKYKVFRELDNLSNRNFLIFVRKLIRKTLA